MRTLISPPHSECKRHLMWLMGFLKANVFHIHFEYPGRNESAERRVGNDHIRRRKDYPGISGIKFIGTLIPMVPLLSEDPASSFFTTDSAQ